MKKVALVTTILCLVSLSAYLYLRKGSVRISDVDFVKGLKAQCANGKLKIHHNHSQPSDYSYHFALVSHQNGEEIIPLASKRQKGRNVPYYEPKNSSIACLKDIKYLRIVSLKNDSNVENLKVINSRISDLKLDLDSLKCIEKNVIVPPTDKSFSKSVELGGIGIKILSLEKRELDFLEKEEFVLSINKAPFLFISRTRVDCDSRFNFYFYHDAFSMINLEESILVGTKKNFKVP